MNQNELAIKLSILFLAGTMTAGCNSKAEANDEEKEVEPAIPVEAVAIVRGRIANYFSGPVALETESDALVVAKASGIVKSIAVEEGQAVRTGQVLAVLENEQETHQLAQAEALLKQYQADYDRNKELFTKNLISAEINDKSQFMVEAQKATWRLAKLQKDNTTIRAPFSGIVAERQIKVGNMITVNTGAFRIVNFETLKAIMYVPEIELAKLEVGQPATLRLDALPGMSYDSEVTLISPIVDPRTGTVKVTVDIVNADGRLKPGMFGRVEILHEIHEQALLLPKEAVLAEDSVPRVYVVSDSLALRRDVTLGMINTLSYEILAGLEEGDLVVTTGQIGLKDSSRVHVVNR